VTNKADIRHDVIESIEKLLIGPRQGTTEFVEGRITLAYLAGMLFPKGEKRSDLAHEASELLEDETDGFVPGSAQEFSGDSDNPLSMANEELPSSVGLSFVLRQGSMFRVEIGAARYLAEKNTAGQRGFRRHPIPDHTVNSDSFNEGSVTVLDGAAELSMIERPSSFRNDCNIVTVSLVNTATVSGSQHKDENLNNRLYQVKLTCRCEEHGIQPYDAYFEKSLDIEESILQLQYKNSPTYAVGHGSSVTWEEPEDEARIAASVSIAYMPRQAVHRPVFDQLSIGTEYQFESKGVFDIRRLAMATELDRHQICSELFGFVEFYDAWIEHQSNLDVRGYEGASSTLIERMRSCFTRMRDGVELLISNSECWRAFTLANLAMLLQIEQTGRLKGARSEREKKRESWPIPWMEKPETFNAELSGLDASFSPHWRPFQLGFFLTAFAGLETPGSVEHEIVDLIWFNTGGGKTEAYLLLSSYELIRRRMRYERPSLGHGTAVITRYTLRFLTADQFSRTASLSCALEKVRFMNTKLLGEEPFSIGLYIGKSQSYKRYSHAITALQALKAAPDGVHKFQVSECPNCGTSLIPEELQYDEEGQPKGFGIQLTPAGKIEYVCQNENCIFSGELKIRVSVIEDDIYENPPSILLGTLDKFALVPWREMAGRIFGRRNSKSYVVPPTLIIQDELHLISGPLGTIAAIYEAGFDTLIRAYQEKLGLPKSGPKYVAASATVRDSEKQIERLTGRKSEIFPPRGITATDSCFSREETEEDTSRIYLGVMAQGVRATSAAHWSSAAILQSVRNTARLMGSKEDCDFLWTLLCYCNSKRELGLINGAVSQEIFERMRVYASAQGQDSEDLDPLTKEEVSADGVRSISETRGNLLVGVSDSGGTSVLDCVPCTNMISVGIDIDRLGAMMVNGQPKTTSEYIQATSRVGRSPLDQGPGLILTLYSPAKPRDRSHYENFKSYHETLYRLVEPTSVTPGSEQALAKACHAALALVIRHGLDGMAGNGDASKLSLSNRSAQDVVDGFRQRMLSTYPPSDVFERERIEDAIDKFLNNWQSWTNSNLQYASMTRNDFSLLTRHDNPPSNNVGVPTMTSMRGVDVEVEVHK